MKGMNKKNSWDCVEELRGYESGWEDHMVWITPTLWVFVQCLLVLCVFWLVWSFYHCTQIHSVDEAFMSVLLHMIVFPINGCVRDTLTS